MSALLEESLQVHPHFPPFRLVQAKTVVKYILQELTPLGESGSEVYHFIPEPINFAEGIKLSDDINKPWLKATLK